jgi:hypothetical protein
MISKYPPMMEKILAKYKLIKLKTMCYKSQTEYFFTIKWWAREVKQKLLGEI